MCEVNIALPARRLSSGHRLDRCALSRRRGGLRACRPALRPASACTANCRKKSVSSPSRRNSGVLPRNPVLLLGDLTHKAMATGCSNPIPNGNGPFHSAHVIQAYDRPRRRHARVYRVRKAPKGSAAFRLSPMLMPTQAWYLACRSPPSRLSIFTKATTSTTT